ncbi:MAG: carotenoid oxygenase family protein [Burkholderiales bacterium]|nr:carotenoid oxygenase family protein [Burkholderiales bacterium]
MNTATSTEHQALQSTAEIVTAYQRGLRDLPREHGFEPLAVDGDMPRDLQGTLYLNGPGLFSLFGRPYQHWFDGDGAMTAVKFGGQVSGAVRLVQSRQLKQERAAGRQLYTSGSTLAPQWHRRLGVRMKNVANTKPLLWNERLFALYEAALPTEMDPATLETLGETDEGGLVKGFFCAHFHEVPSRRAFYNFSIQRGRQNMLHLYEMPAGGAMRRMGSVPLPKSSAMIHDFIVTANHLVFFVPPIRFNLMPMLLGTKAPLQAMQWRGAQEGTTVIVVPIDAPQDYKRFEVEPFFQYHFMNAHEQGGEIVVDFIRVMDFETAFNSHNKEERGGNAATLGRLYRAVVQPQQGTVRMEQRWDQPCEFPQVAPRIQAASQRFGYVLTAKEGQPQTAVAKVDFETGQVETTGLGANRFPGEAVFVPRADAANEDDGYLLAMAYDGEVDRSFIAVMNARDLGRGAVARAWFDHHIPRPLHGSWSGA